MSTRWEILDRRPPPRPLADHDAQVASVRSYCFDKRKQNFVSDGARARVCACVSVSLSCVHYFVNGPTCSIPPPRVSLPQVLMHCDAVLFAADGRSHLAGSCTESRPVMCRTLRSCSAMCRNRVEPPTHATLMWGPAPHNPRLSSCARTKHRAAQTTFFRMEQTARLSSRIPAA